MSKEFEDQINMALENQIKRENCSPINTWMDRGYAVYVIGKNEQSLEVKKRCKISGIIDDNESSASYWNGIPVVKTKEIDPKAIVINCVTSISPVRVRKKLLQAGFINLISLNEIISDDNLIPLPWFVKQQREEIKYNLKAWSDLHDKLADEASKKTLADVLSFRLTADLKSMNDYEIRLNDQYLEDFMKYENEVFIDAGAFDGDTTEAFIKRYPNYKKIYLFEPGKKNFETARKRLRGGRNIKFLQLGLSDFQGELSFNDQAGSASAVTETGQEVIQVVTLDILLPEEPVTFIKLDIEGWEMNALRGAESIIRKNRPKIAVAVYHSAKDFREIPQYLMKINPDYEIHLRHYTQGWSETVMYFR
jgi:FkbM family methyltransferase